MDGRKGGIYITGPREPGFESMLRNNGGDQCNESSNSGGHAAIFIYLFIHSLFSYITFESLTGEDFRCLELDSFIEERRENNTMNSYSNEFQNT